MTYERLREAAIGLLKDRINSDTDLLADLLAEQMKDPSGTSGIGSTQGPGAADLTRKPKSVPFHQTQAYREAARKRMKAYWAKKRGAQRVAKRA